jgi:haloacetate dehalogenase
MFRRGFRPISGPFFGDGVSGLDGGRAGRCSGSVRQTAGKDRDLSLSSKLMPGFAAHEVSAGEVRIHAVAGGSGPPVLLLHGHPQTHVTWHAVAPALKEAGFAVVAADLRGYGDSAKPPGGGDHGAYSKRAMARDQVMLMRALGFPRFAVVGHDRGGRVAHRMALDHPEAVERLAVLDIAPTATMYARTDREFATRYFWWFFLIQPFDLPERLIGADPEFYLRRHIAAQSKAAGVPSEEILQEYLRCYRDPSAIHAICEDYRAAASIDLAHDAADERAGRRIEAPLMALWGTRSTVGALYDVIATWREKSRAEVRGRALDCGHLLQEEAPQETLAELAALLRP